MAMLLSKSEGGKARAGSLGLRDHLGPDEDITFEDLHARGRQVVARMATEIVRPCLGPGRGIR